jgi:subtilisin family serine protease
MPAKKAPARKTAAKKAPARAPAKRSAAKPAAKSAVKSTTRRASAFPDRIFAIASPRSIGGISMFEPGVLVDSSSVSALASPIDVVQRAAQLLSDAGFEVLQVNELMINIAGSRETYEAAFSTTLVSEERATMKQQGVMDTATYIDTTDTPISGLIDTSGTSFNDVLEGVAIEEPAYLATPASFPPPVDYWHLDVPADVSLGCNADKAHRAGITGRDIVVAMVDTGWQSHPWFTSRGYRVDPTVLGPGTADPTIDENGHGTGESANIFSTAPDVLLKPVKTATAGGALVNLTAAFNAAVALSPHIISNSWTSDIQNGPLSAAMQARAAAISAAVASGIVVVFAAGNGHWGFPGQHPDVISVGGVFMERDGSMRASDYSSGFMSNIYPGRRVPDMSGLVGMRPGAQYIMLPVPEGCVLDTSLANGAHPNGDETPTNDGWAAFSGTSAACPQVAGVCALIKQACAHLSPAEIKDILMTTARDVTAGTNHPNFNIPAVVGPDAATGDGLVDAHRAVLVAKLRCMVLPLKPLIPLRPLQPLIPLIPLIPLQPFTPSIPLKPLIPLIPLQPLTPSIPLRPLVPLVPLLPLRPLIPLQPLLPLIPFQPFGPFGPGPGPDPGPFTDAATPQSPPLSAEDVAALERLIVESDDTFGL